MIYKCMFIIKVLEGIYGGTKYIKRNPFNEQASER